MQELKRALRDACKKLFTIDIEPELSRTDEKFGDYTTNVAFKYAERFARFLSDEKDKNRTGEVINVGLPNNPQSPYDYALLVKEALQGLDYLKEVTVAGNGFINFRLTDEALIKVALSATEPPKTRSGQEILVEFGDPNPFKEMHIGHIYSMVAGESIARLLVYSGAQVHRLSYHGDVGLHVAKAIWAIGRKVHWDPEKLKTLDFAKTYVANGAFTIEWGKSIIGELYAEGAKAYETDKRAVDDINEINGAIYRKGNPVVEPIYKWGLSQSFEYFGRIYRLLHIRYDQQYMESESSKVGTEAVVDHVGPVFEKSDGAIIYKGEKKGLHTRVFITSKGLPTYEAKDLGLAILKNRDYPEAAKSIIITAHEQQEYFRVMLAALSEINPELAAKTTHRAHGFVSLSTGKMSSRTGNVYTALDFFDKVYVTVKKQFPDIKDEFILHCLLFGAIKFNFLKYRLGGDVTFNVEESVSLEGNSGPYLQYAYARACSILEKAGFKMPYSIDEHGIEHTQRLKIDAQDLPLDKNERALARKVGEFPEVMALAASELLPSHVTNYLYELAQTFNRFYEASRVIGDDRQAVRLKLVKTYAAVLDSGLNVLGIIAPEKL